MSIKREKYNVPVLMYHSIGVPNLNWNWHYLTCPYDKFEAQLIAIKELGYTTISLNTLYGYMVEGKSIPKKSIALTFDDGYADIWVYAYPLLKKYNMCGTVFINPEFVDPRQSKNENYQHGGKTDHLIKEGYLSWGEIIEMDRQQVVFSESHAMTHTWYSISNKIIDFRNPKDSYTWATWNDNVHIKYKLQIDNPDLKQLGQPIYEYGKSLMHQRYFEDEGLKTMLVDFVKKNGGAQFFDHSNYFSILSAQVDNYRKHNKISDSYESEENYHSRIRFELETSKTILENKLNRKITFLCWPGGSATPIGMDIAKAVGYSFFNCARDMTIKERQDVQNIQYGGNRVKRFTPLVYFNGEENIKSKIIYANKVWMKLYLYRQRSNILYRVIFKLATILVVLFYKIKKD